MKIIVFGCQQIAVDCIRFLLTQKDVEIPLVVSYELPLDKTYGYTSVIDFCKSKKIEVLSLNRIPEALVENIRDMEPDYLFSFYYRKIFPSNLLKIAKRGAINIHPSLLPHYRGPVPTAWAIENGEKEFGLTIHCMDEGIDTGDILVQQAYPIGPDETGYELYTRGMKLGADLFRKNFRKIVNGKIKPRKQQGVGSYYGKKRGQFIIDWQRKAQEIHNQIRVYAKPYNMAETKLLNRYVLVNKARPLYNPKYTPQGPGKIVDILGGNKLVVSCADGCMILKDYEFAPRLSSSDKKLYLKKGNCFG